MNPLAKLFQIKTPEKEENETKSYLNEAEVELTYFQAGYGDAKNANGSSNILNDCLENNYQKFKAHCRESEELQDKYKEPHRLEKVKLEAELEKRIMLTNLKNDAVEALEGDIRNLQGAMSDVKVNPDKYGIDTNRKPKAQFYIGLFMLLPITIYLMVFYMSASYSAFFKTFLNSDLTAAIFDAQAYQKALKEGVMEAIFVCTLPFVFMGLGYLIHMFQMAKSNLWQIKLAVLFAVTFIFDAILAYQIEKKIYGFNKTLDSPDFNISIAVREVEFWGIIFAGFLVYVIWGLVFDFVMKEHEGLDKIRAFLKNKRNELELLLDKKEILKSVINNLKEEMSGLKADIQKEQRTIDGFIFPNRKYLNRHHEYLKGWMMAISQEIALPNKEQEKLILCCQQVSVQHKESHNVHTEDAELVMYETNRATA